MGEGEGDAAELLAVSEERLAELGDSPDPVAQRQVAEALVSKANALRRLSRLPEAIEAWDELVRRVAPSSSEGAQRLVLYALLNKALALNTLGERSQAAEAAEMVVALADSLQEQTELVRRRVLAALLLKEAALAPAERARSSDAENEIIRRFSGVDDPLIHQLVTNALLRAGLGLLRANRIDEALEVVNQLTGRLLSAPEKSLVAEADVANQYARALAAFVGPGWRGVVTVALGTVNSAGWLVNALLDRLEKTALRPLVVVLRLTRSACPSGRTPSRWQHARGRLQAVITLEEAVVRRIGDEPDPELQRLAGTARLQAGFAHVPLGDIGWCRRNLAPLLESADPAIVQTLQAMASRLRGHGDRTSQLGELSTLYLRAQALGEGDARIQRIAYEDSVKPLLDETGHTSVRLLDAWLRSEGNVSRLLRRKADGAGRRLKRRLGR